MPHVEVDIQADGLPCFCWEQDGMCPLLKVCEMKRGRLVLHTLICVGNKWIEVVRAHYIVCKFDGRWGVIILSRIQQLH
jgi:hypothetical protein